jgi:2,4-dienoyl-CoA reductase (NADPH2)
MLSLCGTPIEKEAVMAQSKYEHLFSPYAIGKVQLRNRLVKTAAQTYLFESGETRVGTLAKAFYGAVARGGAGLIITETPAMEWPLMEEGDRRFRVDDDKYIKNLAELSAEVHKYGCPIFTQLYHRGPWGGIYALIAKRVAASAVTMYSPFDVHDEEPPHALTIEEIEELVDRFASGAVRLQAAGWDGIEINAAADHLFHSFLSRFWNKREDIYGPQSMENRTRFIVAVIKEIKKRCGQDFPLQILMNAFEIGAGDEGLTVAEGKEIAQIYQASGVDSLHVRYHWSGMHQGSYLPDNMFYPEPHIPMSEFPKEMDWSHYGALCNVPLAVGIKQVVSIPVMTVAGFDADSAEQVLGEGKADLIGFNRRIFADHEYPNKMRTGRALEVQPCTKCGHCSSTYNEPRHCRINACFGTESYDMAPLGAKKKVLVVGGGPAGMQTARVAAARGHDVTLWEKGKYLGGSMSLAAMVKGFKTEDVRLVIWFLRRQVKKYGVDVHLGKEFDAAAVLEERPDVVVVAAGGKATLPDVPGLDGKNVIKSNDLYGMLRFYLRLLGPKLLRDATSMWMPVGKSAVIIGGAIQGCQLGEFLTKRGRKVTVVDTEGELGKWMYPERKTRLFYWFDHKGVERIEEAKLVQITKDGLTLTTKDGQLRTLKADNVICALPFAADHSLVESLKELVPEVYSVGDCEDPGLIPNATAAGWKVGNSI